MSLTQISCQLRRKYTRKLTSNSPFWPPYTVKRESPNKKKTVIEADRMVVEYEINGGKETK